MTTLFVDIQGFFSQYFQPKEMTVTCDGNKYYHYLFKSPIKYMKLNTNQRKVVHHCLKYSNGLIDVGEIGPILRLFNPKTVYVKGHQKLEFLKTVLSCNIINIEASDIPKFQAVHHNCPYHLKEYSICSYENVKWLYNFITFCQRNV